MFVAVGCTAAILAGTGLSDVAGFSEEIVACIADVASLEILLGLQLFA